MFTTVIKFIKKNKTNVIVSVVSSALTVVAIIALVLSVGVFSNLRMAWRNAMERSFGSRGDMRGESIKRYDSGVPDQELQQTPTPTPPVTIRPYLGLRYLPITPALKEKNYLTVGYGVIVLRGQTSEDLAVVPGSPADKAGIVEGDIILEVDGVKLDQSQSLSEIIKQKQIDQVIQLKLLHKGQEKEVSVTLEKAPNNF